jgi:hypothetical protein
MSDDTYFGQVRHWLVTDVSTDSDGTLKIDQGKEISSYVGPAPLPNYLYESYKSHMLPRSQASRARFRIW